jgi:hypothetical protein
MFSSATRLFHNKKFFFILLGGTILMMGIMVISGRPLNTTETPFGILHLEFAGTKKELQNVLSAWQINSSINNDIIAAAKTNTWFDFLFLLFYTLFLFSSCKWLSGLVMNKYLSFILSFFAGAAILAGILDILENVGMLLSLSGMVTQGIAGFTSIASITKWVLVFSIMASLLWGIAAVFFQHRKPK